MLMLTIIVWTIAALFALLIFARAYRLLAEKNQRDARHRELAREDHERQRDRQIPFM